MRSSVEAGGPAPARRAAWAVLAAWLRAGPARGRLGSRRRPFPPRALEPAAQAAARRLAEGAVKRFGTLAAVLQAIAGGRRPRPEGLYAALLLGAYELFFEPSVPAHAAVSEAVALARRAAGSGGAGFANACLRRLAGRRELAAWLPPPEPAPDPADPKARARLAAWHSLPEVLVGRWLADFGPERAARLFAAANARPHLGLRVRSARREPEALAERLRAAGFPVRPGPHPGTLVLPAGEGRGAILETEAFREGLFAIQDASSAEAADLLQVEPGMRVLDLCAGPGGKTLALAERLAGRGELIAHDIRPERLSGLPRELERLGLSGVRIVAGPDAFAEVAAAAPYDRILVDAPCTNTGVLARRAEARWRFSVEKLAELAGTQRSLLERALPLLARGGLLVYSVCSLEPEECLTLVRSLSLPPGCRLLSAERLLPEPGLRDGLSVAVFIRDP